MSLRPEEEHAARSIVRLLEGLKLEAEYSEGDDPPDIVITFDNTRLAIEVTGLHQYVNNDGREQPFLEIHAHTRSLVDRIRQAAAADTIVGYQVLARGPFSKQEEGEILDQAVVFIRSGASDPADLGPDGAFRIIPVLRKVGIGLGVGISGRVPGGDGKSSVYDHFANVSFAVERAIEAKAETVAQLPGHQSVARVIGSSGRTRTYNPAVNSRMLYH